MFFDDTLHKMFRARAEAAISVLHPELSRPEAARPKAASEPMHPFSRQLSSALALVAWGGFLVSLLPVSAPAREATLVAIGVDSILRLAQTIGLLPTGFYGGRAWRRLFVRLAIYGVLVLFTINPMLVFVAGLVTLPLWIRRIDPFMMAAVARIETTRLRQGKQPNLPEGYLEQYVADRRAELANSD